MAISKQVKIVEVGPRDGLQNEVNLISAYAKAELIERLVASGLTYIESGSFVNPKWVPQMADSDAVFSNIKKRPNVTYAALVPNLIGYDRAIQVGATEVAIFASASEAFSQKNINCSIAESLKRFEPLLEKAREQGIAVRGYVSCVVGCPYDGEVEPKQVAHVTQALFNMGCYEVSLGDTIGVGTPATVNRMLDAVLLDHSVDKLALHMHDTYGQALTNIYAGLLRGISVFDASVAGLGGCPYAKGASGNLATEDLVYLLNGLNIEHGVNLPKLIEAGHHICNELGRKTTSKVARAMS